MNYTENRLDSLRHEYELQLAMYQADPVQEATAIALLKGLIELGKTVGTENTLQLIQTALGGLNEKDFATQATLAQVLTKLGDLSTATNQDAAKTVLDAISNAVATRATELTLGEIKTALTDGTQQVQLTGNLTAIKGQYGDALIPVQVDAEGRIVLAADVIMEYYGATASERPAVADVPVGAVYMAVRTQEMWQSDGTQWVVM